MLGVRRFGSIELSENQTYTISSVKESFLLYLFDFYQTSICALSLFYGPSTKYIGGSDESRISYDPSASGGGYIFAAYKSGSNLIVKSLRSGTIKVNIAIIEL